MASPTICTITGIGGLSPTTLGLNGITWSRGVSLNGTCSAELVTADLKAAGILPNPTALDDQWFAFRHPRLGDWAGEIQTVRHSSDTGTTEVAAQDWSALLQGRRAAQTLTISPAAAAGDVLSRVITDAGRMEGPLWIEDVLFDSDGWPIELTVRADDIGEAFRQIVVASGMEYRFNSDRTVELRRRFGQDLTDRIQVVWGTDIVGFEFLSARSAVVNDLLAVPADSTLAEDGSFVVEDPDAIEAGRRRQGTKTYPSFVGKSVMRPIAEADLARLVLAGQTPTIDLCNDNGVFGSFRAGDTVRVILPTINGAFDFRVMVESWDMATDLLRLSGVVTKAS